MFTHLHCHFLGSYSDSLLDPDRDLAWIKEMGQKAIAITDHGVIDTKFANPGKPRVNCVS